MLSLLGFVACESKSNHTIFSTSLIKKRLFRDISFNFQIMVLISIVSSYLSSNKLHSAQYALLLSFCWEGGGGLSLLLNFQKGGAWQDLSPQISGSQRCAAGKDRADFYHGGCSLYIKNKLKSEIFNNKKDL